MAPGESPKWHYKGPDPCSRLDRQGEDATRPENQFPPLAGEFAMNLGTYSRTEVSNLDDATGRAYFDQGLRHFFSYQHEMASKYFLACLYFSPQCALAHSLVALCHSPNYNFKGDAYYDSTHHPEEMNMPDRLCVFPSQQVADRHSRMAVEKVEEIRAMRKRSAGKRKKATGRGKSELRALSPEESSSSSSIDIPDITADVDVQIASAVRILTCTPGISSGLSVELVGRPYANALRKVHELYPDDAEVSYFLAEALMVLNAWKLYEYPTGRPLSNDVVETREVLEDALTKHKDHAGLCHMYVHLSEMSSDPAKALDYCGPLRNNFPHAGHLIHMPSHVDVLVGDYESVIRWNYAAILADDHTARSSPDTAGTASFYFGYCVHNYHMLVYGCILGGYEAKAMKVAEKLNLALSEEMFVENPDLVAYLESYSALEVHVMVRFGRWKEILQLKPPEDKHLMLFRAASIKFARGMAYANSGDVEEAKKEADRYDSLRKHPLAETRILHNNQVSDLLAVDAPMLRGEIAYREGKYDDAFRLLRKAVEMQDNLNYDEPWGKMQPIRHALGGLLLEQGNLVEAEEVFRTDLSFHPRNPWGLRGLIQCLEKKVSLSAQAEMDTLNAELSLLRGQLAKQRASEWADFNVTVACECCRKEGLKL